jgi:hypothetical protein
VREAGVELRGTVATGHANADRAESR